jgi:methionyl-tRNA formyltransferase
MPVSSSQNRRKVVFLGTPAVARRALEILLEAEKTLQVVLVVSQPPARSPRGQSLVPSPVHQLAIERGIPVATPETARDETFLADLEALAPHLCITAAYGNVLPERFLAIPTHGTLNIHPSLLPRYRGAAPVQRALEDGATESGVTIALTVKAMDAGPVVAQARVPVDPNEKAPAFLLRMFELGARALLDVLPDWFAGQKEAVPQDSALATQARKLSVDEGVLRWNESAQRLHDRVRAFAGWPGTRARLYFAGEAQDVKVVTTRVGGGHDERPRKECELRGDALVVVCDDGSRLEIVELQPPGKRVLSAKEFWNGLRNKDVRRADAPVIGEKE